MLSKYIISYTKNPREIKARNMTQWRHLTCIFRSANDLLELAES